MVVKGNFRVTRGKDGYIWTNLSGQWEKEERPEIVPIYEDILHVCKKRTMSELDRQYAIDELLKKLHSALIKQSNTEGQGIDPAVVKATLSKIIDFFTEFDFEPNFRFVNTLARTAIISRENAKAYIVSYFDLTDKLSTELPEKLNSREFNDMLDILTKVDIKKQVNTRLKLFYGSQGTGKTTALVEETNNNVVPCHSAMLPSDLMEDFEFVDGKAIFKPSALQMAMVNGQKIGLDEINLLPFESLRFLQSVLDGKSQFIYKGKTIVIKEGFEVIGSMNLYVNGSIFALPEPLVDRAYELKKFKLDADNLYAALA